MSDKKERRGFFATLKSGKAAAAASNSAGKDGGVKRYRGENSKRKSCSRPVCYKTEIALRNWQFY